MINPELLLLSYPVAVLLSLIAWLLRLRRGVFLYLIPAFIPLAAVLLFLQNPQSQYAETAIPFLSASERFALEIRLQFDQLRCGLALLVALLCFLIQLHSTRYLKESDSQGYFHFLIGLFQLAMAGLFLSSSLFSLFIFWEMVGLLSWLLVQFWYRKEEAVASAFQVILINKAGDFFLLSGIGLLVSFGLFFPVSVKTEFPEGAGIFLDSPTGQVICFFLLISAVIKSAQFPFSVWLKRAMAGPASVSALLHSATMVAAGVWLMSRLSPFMPPVVMQVLAVTGLISLLAGNLAAMASQHLKSTLAFSTMAQLGLMMAGLGLCRTEGVMLHLICHAFFKAGLFLLCGWLMQAMLHSGVPEKETDSYERLGGILAKSLPAKAALMILLAALAGLPLTSGFISKESLFGSPWESGSGFEWMMFAGMQAGTFLTAVYAGRIFLTLCFRGENEAPAFPFAMAFPVFLLALASGFWILGFNPFSSEGWLTAFLGIGGHSVSPDFAAALLGLGFAWLSRDYAFYRQFPAVFQSVFMEFRPAAFVMKKGGAALVFLAGLGRRTDDRVLDSGLEMASKSLVVAGYFSRFTDRYVLDGLLRLSGSFFYRTGGMLFVQAKQSARFAAWVAILVLILLIYFSYYR